MELKRQKIYKKVFDMACELLLSSNMEAQFANAGALCTGQGESLTVEVQYFDESIAIEVPQFLFASSKGANVTLVTKIILLHYIGRASGEQPSPLEQRISYGDIPGGRHYLPVFEKRVSRPLESAFGHNRDLFLDAGLSLGGREEDLGDVSFTLFALPKVPVTFILWEGDPEFPPSIKVLFDPSIAGYLSLEDVVVLSKLAVTRIMKAARLRASEEFGD